MVHRSEIGTGKHCQGNTNIVEIPPACAPACVRSRTHSSGVPMELARRFPPRIFYVCIVYFTMDER